MNWNIPQWDKLQPPKKPQWKRLITYLSLFIFVTFNILMNLLPDKQLPFYSKESLICLILLSLMGFLILMVRYWIYAMGRYRVEIYGQLVDKEIESAQAWANEFWSIVHQHRITCVDEKNLFNKEEMSYPVNLNNSLKLASLENHYAWDKYQTLINDLILSLSTYVTSYKQKLPIKILWSVNSEIQEKIDWSQLIKESVIKCGLTIEQVELVSHTSSLLWLSTHFDDLENTLYALINLQLDNDAVSEEATLLIMANANTCHHLKLPIKAKLLRPLVCSPDSIMTALQLSLEYQTAGTELTVAWHSPLTKKTMDEFLLTCTNLHCAFLPNKLINHESLWGKSGEYRDATLLTLIAELSGKHLVVYAHEEQLCLQQILV